MSVFSFWYNLVFVDVHGDSFHFGLGRKPEPLNLGLEARQNTGFTPKTESAPSPVPGTLLMAGVALPDGDGGVSQGRQPMGTPGTGAGGLRRDAPEGRELAGSRCPDPGLRLAQLLRPRAEIVPSIRKWV